MSGGFGDPLAIDCRLAGIAQPVGSFAAHGATTTAPRAGMPSVLASAAPHHVTMQPFPHLIDRNALPAGLYGRLHDLFPPEATILRGRRGVAENTVARLSAVKVVEDPSIASEWCEFFALHTSAAFWSEIVRVFGETIRATFPMLEERLGRPLGELQVGMRGADDEADVLLDCQFAINTPGMRASSVKTPHVDDRKTVFAGLYYLREPDDRSEGGDLELYRWARAPRLLRHRMILPGDVVRSRSVPYAANMLACFVNSRESVHGVSPRSLASKPRRYINLVAQLRFDAFTTPKVALPSRVVHCFQMRHVGRRRINGAGY
ncbi:hypothetical protein [Hypericibacter sp.]|uniref:hypothetical protein n=1 Tax=Hypericibacter sp. TaxID=2705401 RepID=UPI003D6D23C8